MLQCYQFCQHHSPPGVCDSQEDLQNLDKECVKFAKYFLKDLCFMYRDADYDDKKICDAEYSLIIYIIILRNGRGSFMGPLSSRFSLLTSQQLKVP